MRVSGLSSTCPSRFMQIHNGWVCRHCLYEAHALNIPDTYQVVQTNPSKYKVPAGSAHLPRQAVVKLYNQMSMPKFCYCMLFSATCILNVGLVVSTGTELRIITSFYHAVSLSDCAFAFLLRFEAFHRGRSRCR